MAWQTLIVVLLVAAAAAYLARVAWQSLARRRAAACGGCGSCQAGAANEPTVQVTIQSLVRSTPARGKHDD